MATLMLRLRLLCHEMMSARILALVIRLQHRYTIGRNGCWVAAWSLRATSGRVAVGAPVGGGTKSIGSPTGSLLLAKGRADPGCWCNVIGTVVMVCGLYVAVQYVAKAVVAAHSVLAVVLMPRELCFLWRVSRLQWAAYLKRLVRPLLTSGIMGAVVYGTCVALRGVLPPAIVLLVLVVEGGLVYFLAWRVVAREYVPALWRQWRAKSQSGV